MNTYKKRRLGELLQELNMVSEKDVEHALKEGKKRGLRLGEALIELGILTEQQIHWALAENLGLSYVHVSEDQVQPEVVRLVPEEMARAAHILPLLKIGNELTLVVDDPLQEELFEDIARLTGCKVNLVLGRRQEILKALDHVYGQTEAAAALAAEGLRSAKYKDAQLKRMNGDRSGSEALRTLIQDAWEEGVDAVHLEFYTDQGAKRVSQVRFRHGERLTKVLEMDSGWAAALRNRLRIWAGAAEGSEAKGRQFSLELPERSFALSLHSRQVRGGEVAALYFLGRQVKPLKFNQLGLTAGQRGMVEAMLPAAGLIVITGPRASGRTTTVYSLLDKFKPDISRIITVEQRLHQERPEFVQVELGEERKDTAIESLLNLDPDVLYVEALKGKEETEAALAAGMSGKVLFTLMGFSGAASVLEYLISLGLSRALLAEGLNGVIAQRLIRRLCEKCKKESKPPAARLAALDPETRDKLAQARLYEAKGCRECQGTGISGREAIFEVLPLRGNTREALLHGRPVKEILGSALDSGFKPLGERLLEKTLAGECAWTEILTLR